MAVVLCSGIAGDNNRAVAAGSLKKPLAGLVDMGDISFHRQDGGVAHTNVNDLSPYRGVFGGIVINVTWDQVERTRAKIVTDEIDHALADIREYNRANPQHTIGARLRVWPGPNAPQWAKELGGKPVQILHRDLPITVGRYWSKPYREAWRDFQNRLAARYDSEPLIREVTNTSGSSITDETFLLPGDSESIKNLLAAGFTDKLYQDCLTESLSDYVAWRTTGIECIFSPYRAIDSGQPKLNMAFTLSSMQSLRQSFGTRIVLGHHALQSPIPERFIPMYQKMSALGPPIALQTHAPRNINLEETIRAGIAARATSIELWSEARFGGFQSLTPAKVKSFGEIFP